jgi:peroxiredoxin
MKRIVTQLLAAIFFCTFVNAQTSKISFSGKLKDSVKTTVIHIQHLEGVSIPVPVTAQHRFSWVTDTVKRGFYQAEGIGMMYLCPGYQLTVQPDNKGEYIFKGKGALENNALRTAKKQLSDFFPVNGEKDSATAAAGVGELQQAAYYLEPSVFLQKLDSFQKKGALLFKESSDTFFSKYATLDLLFYGKHLLSLYQTFCGKDLEKWEQSTQLMIQLDNQSPDFMEKLDSLMKSAQVKQISWNETLKIYGALSARWDTDDETLFRNSPWYRQAFQLFFTMKMMDKKYAVSLTMNIDSEPKVTAADPAIRTLAVVLGEIKNPYILAYFDYTTTQSILQKTGDTALLSKYYNEYLARTKDGTYLTEIKNVYHNRLTYTDHKPAPDFSYKDVGGKTVSLADFRGKFVYIDVWATWCAPCKAELPHLKDLEAAYQHKNIQFVSISVDVQEDKEKWKEFVKKNGLTGIQLVSDHAFESAFIGKMNISSIPRFILIDPEGKIVAADALRPSDKDLRTSLDKLL